jgi:mannose-1-phosphate guanylyltransferase/mannose-1-phosphate guanylyltransferase/mannose-6-phosphate isomerase
VVAGTVQVTINDDVIILEPSQTMRVPSGARSRIENPAKVPARVIEVLCGDHVIEHDIMLDDKLHT